MNFLVEYEDDSTHRNAGKTTVVSKKNKYVQTGKNNSRYRS